MNKEIFRKIHRRIRLIKKAKYVGDAGYLSDLVKEYGVSMDFLRNTRENLKPLLPKKVGIYTREYQEKLAHEAYWESYGERKWKC